jgi:4,5-DOPA dioxygenase extradiol
VSRMAVYHGPERRRGSGRRVPALFVAHGAPDTVLDEEFGNALRRFGGRQARLDGAVVVSAHWESLRPIRVTRSPHPDLLYDFPDMPARVDQMSFSCAGSPSVSDRVLRMLDAAGLQATADPARGFDHGTWVPLSLLFHSGRVPIVQVSLPTPARPEEVVELGRALAPLRDQNILLVGSGGIVHNLHRLRFSGEHQEPAPWALGFDGWVRDRVSGLDLAALCDYRRRAPHALESVPTPEHFNPLLFVLGAAGAGDRAVDVYEGFRHGSLSMRSFALVSRRHGDAAAGW